MLNEINVLTFALTPSAALKLIKSLSMDSSRIYYTKHAEKGMNKRKISQTQVLRCLRHGTAVEGPARSIKGNWEIRLEVFTAGEPLSVVVALENDGSGNYIIVITAYRS